MLFQISGLRSSVIPSILAAVWFLSSATGQITPTFGGNGPSDPGPRGGQAAAGGPLAGLNNVPGMLAAFNSGSVDFQEVENVRDDGLGPRFNATCHTVTLQTGASPFPMLANQTIHPYSDFALHHMGPRLADQISQGLAEGRTAPLWGLGQRLFFLHDGRTSDLVQAIREHSSDRNSQFPPSEANAVARNFFNLTNSDQQAVLKFLRSL